MFKLLNKKKNNKGFTLVELVIVVAILAILVGLLAPQYTQYVEKSRKSADASNMDEMVKAVQVYAADTANAVPAVTNVTIELTKDGVTSANETVNAALNEFCPDYSKMSMKSAKWGGNPTATINITDEGGVEVSYAPANFAKYINAKGTTASTNQGGKKD